MATPTSATPGVAQTIEQLNKARLLCLGDPSYYSKVVPGVLPIVGVQAALELRQWGADFLAEVFASPVVPTEDKQAMALQALQLLKGYLDAPAQDFAIVRSTIQALCSVYPLIFRYTALTSNNSEWGHWSALMEAKSRILRQMDSASAGLRIVCVKFVQQVILTQTPGIISDPRRPEQNEISLALVPQGHQLLSASKLEAEASGLLDRILGILQENNDDALQVTATLNSLGALVKSRATISNKIITAVLNFNPFKLSDQPLTPLIRVQMRSMERTTRSLLSNVLKRTPNQPQAQRIHGYLERMVQMRINVYDEGASRKRHAPQPSEPEVPAKRTRVEPSAPVAAPAGLPIPQPIPAAPIPAPNGVMSYADLYTLTDDPGTRNFDVRAIPQDIVCRVITPILQSLDRTQLDIALNAVRTRYLALSQQQMQRQMQAPATAIAPLAAAPVPPADEEDEDYEPDFAPSESADQVNNRVEMDTAEEFAVQPVALGPFRLPPPPLLSQPAIIRLNERAVQHFYTNLDTSALAKSGPQALAGAARDTQANLTFIERLSTRLPVGLDTKVKPEDQKQKSPTENFRLRLLAYILEDWRRRIHIAISWLTEEWETDREVFHQKAKKKKQKTNKPNGTTTHAADAEAERQTKIIPQTPNYDRWVVKFLNDLTAFIGNEMSETKILMRFLSEIPKIDLEIVNKVKALALDPERIPLVVTSLRFLIAFRPALRELALDAMEDLWRNYDGAQRLTLKDLTKWRPNVVQSKAEGTVTTAAPAALEVKIEA